MFPAAEQQRWQPPPTAELCVVFVVLCAPLLSVAIFVVSPISAFGKMALAGGVSVQSLSPSHSTAFWKEVGVAEMWCGNFCTVGLIK